MLERKLNVGIGTDGANCCDNQNMYESMRARRRWSRRRKGPDTDRWLTTEEVLEAATDGSARALGFGDKLGRIAKGYKADLVFLDLHTSTGCPATTRPTSSSTPRTAAPCIPSWSGAMVVENRRPSASTFRRWPRRPKPRASALRPLNAGNKALFERLQGLVNGFCPGLAKTPYHIDHFAGAHHAH